MGSKIADNIHKDAELVATDDSRLYHNLGRKGYTHEIVNHTNKEWVRGDVHTQSVENFWSLFKRGVIGNFHKVSIKHLQRYLNEFPQGSLENRPMRVTSKPANGTDPEQGLLYPAEGG